MQGAAVGGKCVIKRVTTYTLLYLLFCKALLFLANGGCGYHLANMHLPTDLVGCQHMSNGWIITIMTIILA